ncbi:hypothetical protein HID58_067058, partial [Brassica napus]
RASDNVFPSRFDPESLCSQDGQTVVKAEFMAHPVNPKEADAYWLATCDLKAPPHESGNLIRDGPYFWGHYSLRRVLLAMAYHCSRLQPDLPVEEESEPKIRGERERSRSPKIKQIAVDGDDDAIYGLECPTDESFRNFLNSQA